MVRAWSRVVSFRIRREKRNKRSSIVAHQGVGEATFCVWEMEEGPCQNPWNRRGREQQCGKASHGFARVT